MYDIQRIMSSINLEEIIKNIDKLKTERKVFTVIDHDSIQEHNFALVDYAAMEVVESGKFEILTLLYPHLTSERHAMYPDSCTLSVKDIILTHLIQNNVGRSMIQTILDDESYDPSYPHDNVPLQEAIEHSNVEIVMLLLSHPRVKICEDTVDDGLMTKACIYSDSDAGVEILKLLLDDPRFNPSRDANDPMDTLAHYCRNSGLACIVNCSRIRWDWFGRPSPLAKCVKNKNMEGVRILLDQSQYDPCMNNNEAYEVAKEMQSTHPEFMTELMNDERIAKCIYQKSKRD
jgi:hypothetical protein